MHWGAYAFCIRLGESECLATIGKSFGENQTMTTERAAIDRLCTDLGLPRGDAFTQDWAYELPEQFRTEDWLRRYLSAYDNPAYGDSERRMLIMLALDIANDLLNDDEEAGERACASLERVLRSRVELHRDQLEYWALEGEPLEDVFTLTPWAREQLSASIK